MVRAENIKTTIENIGIVIKNFVEYIESALGWLPIPIVELRKYLLIALLIGIATIVFDIIVPNEKDNYKVSCFYWGTMISFAFSMVVLSLFYQWIGEMGANDVPFILVISLATSGVVSLQVGAFSFFNIEGLTGCVFAPILTLLLWTTVAVIAVSIHYIAIGEPMTFLAFLFLAAIPGALFGTGETIYVRISIEIW